MLSRLIKQIKARIYGINGGIIMCDLMDCKDCRHLCKNEINDYEVEKLWEKFEDVLFIEMVSLIVKVLWKLISLICFRVYLEVNVHKNPTCFSRWSVRGKCRQHSKANIAKDMQ